MGWNTLLTAIAFNLGALFAGAGAVRAAAKSGWRSVAEVRVGVAVVGAAAVGWLVLVRIDQALNWASVVALLLVPAAFALGTRFEHLQLPSIRIVAAALLVGLVVSIGMGMVTTTTGGAMSEPRAWDPYAGSTMIAPWWQEPMSDAPPLFSDSSSAYPETGVIDLTIETTDPAALALFHDYRLEAWRADSWDEGGSLVPGQSAPFATAAATPEEGWVHATLRFNRTPGVEHARLALTAIGRDGQRYLLYLSGTEETEFHGSVWDWSAALVQQWTK